MIPLVYLMFPFRPTCRAAAASSRGPHYRHDDCLAGLRHSMGKFSQPNTKAGFPAAECALAARPPAAHLELSPPSEYIQQDGSVPSVTHSAESIRLGNVRRSDASPPLVPREAAAACARAVVHPAQHVHLTCPDPPAPAAPAEPLLPPSFELMNKCMKCHPENGK